MQTYSLRFELLSAATFGRGDGVAGLVDREIEHDAEGLPYLGGRTLKGLLAEECANLLYALDQQGHPELQAQWQATAYRLFGQPGSRSEDKGAMRVGNGQLPAPLRAAVKAALARPEFNLTPTDILESLTGVRRQTAMTVHGAPEDRSLRSMRVIRRGLTFEASLEFPDWPADAHPPADELALLAACVLAWRRAGTGRNRGRGCLRAHLYDAQDQDITPTYFRVFQARMGV